MMSTSDDDRRHPSAFVEHLDISERQRLEESRQQLLDIMEAVCDYVWIVDGDGRIRYANHAACGLMGVARLEAVLGRALAEACGQEPGCHLLGDCLRSALAQGHYHGEVELRRNDGGGMTVYLTVRAHRDAQGHLRYLSLVMHDISERKQREEELSRRNAELHRAYSQLQEAQNQLLQSERMASIGQLAAGVAHEINNPIGYVYSNLATLEDYIRSILAALESYERMVGRAGSQAELLAQLRERHDLDYILQDLPQLLEESKEGIARVKKIVQDLKDFSHGGIPDEWQWADIHRSLDSAINIAWNEIKYRARLEKDYGALPSIQCLPLQLNQVFLNILINAAHAIDRDGHITVRTRPLPEQICVEISDSGCGIPAEHLGRIFEPFFTTKPVGTGTGLGLALSYGIVKKHSGKIEVESAVGAGTTFRILLPISQERRAQGR
ncbi:MAG TPA: ATP-binding protein [Candidatus Competibacteraceae bacterium]|nr:ATP-binding protein [Candidatus Competibacteraceae bacterium]